MSRRLGTRKYTPYSELSPRRRRDAFIRLRGKILGDTQTYGGKFTSHQILHEPGRPALLNQWFDFLFLGLDGRTIWNAEITTARKRFWDDVESLALAVKVQQVVPVQAEAADGRLGFYPAVWSVPVVSVQPDRQLGGAVI